METVSQDPEKWTKALLHEFCVSHNLKRSGKKEELLQRVKEFLESHNLESPTLPASTSTKSPSSELSSSSTVSFPSVGWVTLQAGRTKCPEFSTATILSLFLDSRRSDGLPNANFKAVLGDGKAIRLFQAGYVSRIRLVRVENNVYFAAQCQPEMRSSADYQIRFAVRSTPPVGKAVAVVEEFLSSQCTCPAGKGPSATCKHIAAVMYGLEEFSRLGYIRETITCTGKLQEWNKPHSKKILPMQVSEMDFRKKSVGKQLNESQQRNRPKQASADLMDPRPVSQRGKAQERVDQLLRRQSADSEVDCLFLAAGSSTFAEKKRQERLARCDDQKQRWLKEHDQTLVAALEGFDFDNETESDSDFESLETAEEPQTTQAISDQSMNLAQETKISFASTDEFYQKMVEVTQQQAAEIERKTRLQSGCDEWFQQRRLRLTATICKDIVCRRKADVTRLVQNKLKETFSGNAATEYGLEHEADAVTEYIDFQLQSDPLLRVQPSGLVVSVDHPYLACSPDGIVSSSHGEGLLEVKCPFSCRVTPLAVAARAQSSFFLRINDGDLALKRSHKYFYQVQMSLLVLNLEWADFVVWTPSEIFVERLQRDEDLLLKIQPLLQQFYHQHLLPALFAASEGVKTPPRIELREANLEGVKVFYFPQNVCQSRLDGRNGSTACTLIATHVVYRLLAGEMEHVHPSSTLPQDVAAKFVESMRQGNLAYDGANLGGQLLGIYDALEILPSLHLCVAPRGDIGCRKSDALSVELMRLSKQAADEGKLLAGLLVQSPFTVALSISPNRLLTIFDSHQHGVDKGALIACMPCTCSEESEKAAVFIASLVGVISDCHFCLLVL